MASVEEAWRSGKNKNLGSLHAFSEGLFVCVCSATAGQQRVSKSDNKKRECK